MYKEWEKTLDSLQQKTDPQHFEVWFKSLKVKSRDQSSVTLSVPNRFMKDWLSKNYLDILEDEVSKQAGKTMQVKLVSRPAEKKETQTPKVFHKTLHRQEIEAPSSHHFNAKFTFDDFVVGKTNEFAHAACKAVARAPGDAYNPLTLYGGTGLGKTHLLHAIGHELKKNYPGLKVVYLSSETFMNQLIASIAGSKMEDFRRRYRERCDVLLVDDVQFIAGKTSTQEEFFHTFNALHQLGKQVVVTTDQFPQELKNLDERIRSRLVSGLTADIKEPDMETRAAILKRKAESSAIDIPDDVVDFLAKNVRNNVRELEGCLLRLRAKSSFNHCPITLALAKDTLKNFMNVSSGVITPERIFTIVSRYYEINPSQLKSRSRARNVVLPRQVAMYLMKKHTDLVLSGIGKEFGGKDHTTVMASIRKIEKSIMEDKTLRDSIETLEKQLLD